MPTADEVFSELAESDIDDVIIIDNELRTMSIPSSMQIIGVESDDSVFRLKFKMPATYGEFDLSEFSIRINYVNAASAGDIYVIDDKEIALDQITFTWLIGRQAFAKQGSVRFNICLRKFDTDNTTAVKEFNTTPATLTVLEGLETDNAVIEPYTDLVNQLIQKTTEATNNANTASTKAINAANSANTAMTNANTATDRCTKAINNLDTQAGVLLDRIANVITNANTATTNANEAASSANAAADNANTAAEKALAAANTIYALRRVDGVYTNIKEHLGSRKDGKIYSVKIPNYSSTTSTACTKLDANANLTCYPSTTTSSGRDDYQSILAFYNKDCNFYVNDNGEIFVTAIEGDEWFARDGSNGDVGVLTPTLYWRVIRTTDASTISISDTMHENFDIQPGGKLVDGTVRPFIVYAKYPGVKYNNKYSSVSGLPIWTRDISQNSLIDLCAEKGAGYSGKTGADDWYISTMFYLIFANKSSQEYLKGCCSYDYQYSPAIAETGVRRVVITNDDAKNLVVGSCMMFGTHTGTNVGRKESYNYDIFDGRKISAIETYDSTHKSVYFEGDQTFDTQTTYLLQTAPWYSGACDSVNGRNGYVRNDQKGPFLIQGIECMHGVYEIIANVIANIQKDLEGNNAVRVYICDDCANYQKNSITGYEFNLNIPLSSSGGWSYTQDVKYIHNLYMPYGYDASSTTGNGDAIYHYPTGGLGFRQWATFGSLDYVTFGGLRCVNVGDGLSNTFWNIGSRLSALGRSSV